MDEQQSAPDGDGKPHAAGTPYQDKAYELPPPPAPGALWASPGDEPARSAPVPAPGGSTRPISATPSANAARAMVPGALRPDPGLARSSAWPSGQSTVY